VSDTDTATGEVPAKDIRLVITASSLGTAFEWYDFFIYGTLAASGIIGRTFFPAGSEMMQTLLAWAGFAVGFGFRPLGAVLFGFIGDRLGRKYTFLVTITLMGLATAGVGLVPSYAAIGAAAPAIIILLRILQGLALGGEYGGAAIYVAEHATAKRRGFYTSFIQASVSGGFILSLAVVLLVKGMLSADAWADWGWRVPFLFSIALLAVSLWMRLKLSESPVFTAMKAAGQTARNPFIESFTYPGNGRRLLVALLGIAAGLTVIWYTALFSVLSFLQGPMRVAETPAQLITGAGAAMGLVFFIAFGALSDRVGRKPLMVGFGVLGVIGTWPVFVALETERNPWIAGLLVLAALVAVTGYTAINAVVKAELFPAHIRALGVALPYAISNALFGGTAEYVALWFKQAGWERGFYLYVTTMIGVSLIVYLRMRDTRDTSRIVAN
jgi:MFS family permease